MQPFLDEGAFVELLNGQVDDLSLRFIGHQSGQAADERMVAVDFQNAFGGLVLLIEQAPQPIHFPIGRALRRYQTNWAVLECFRRPYFHHFITQGGYTAADQPVEISLI